MSEFIFAFHQVPINKTNTNTRHSRNSYWKVFLGVYQSGSQHLALHFSRVGDTCAQVPSREPAFQETKGQLCLELLPTANFLVGNTSGGPTLLTVW